MEKFTIPVVVEAPTEADAVRVLGEYLTWAAAEPKDEAGNYIEHSIWSWGEA
ncbi:hypothetical protein [Mycolicibacterium conceptionense]|uniref:hypothetical protein n=1 Tax=Mycolicibacterium conceptionense TaxID=451644 RepID=UPI000A545D6F|nr:hypothetical protein [Mycolicibacterium conceptionense]